jgi:Ser/Thr protein kinase RdoA (MazF antagonist)
LGLERRLSPYRSSFALEELDVHLDDGTSLSLLFKGLSRQEMPPSSRRAKPEFLYNPLRELLLYKEILPLETLGTAECYGTVVDTQAGRYWLFLERVPGLPLCQIGDFETWREAARWLARLHGRYSRQVDCIANSKHLINYNRPFYELWIKRVQVFLACRGSRRETPATVKLLAERHRQAVARLVELPQTLIHGEFYAANVLIDATRDRLRVCPVDWEMAGVGPALIDVAALTAGKWTEDERRDLALAYHAALEPQDSWPPAPEAFLSALDFCRFHLSMQWIGWSPSWSPPPEQAHDWLGEALYLAGKLGL